MLTRDVEEFASHTESLLWSRIECNVMATVLISLRTGRLNVRDALFGYALGDTGTAIAAAMRTAPWPLLTSPLGRLDALQLIEAWVAEDSAVSGVSGTPETAREIAGAWARLTGATTRVRMREAMHELHSVLDPPHPARGELRVGEAGDTEVLTAWMAAFLEEANVAGAEQAAEMVSARIARGSLFVWDDGGPVSFVGVQPQVAGVVRIGPVYTPPEHRRRGYAGSAVAGASRNALSNGADRCMLFTDLANPTSNKIYAEVGYRRIGDWEEYEFEPAGGRR